MGQGREDTGHPCPSPARLGLVAAGLARLPGLSVAKAVGQSPIFPFGLAALRCACSPGHDPGPAADLSAVPASRMALLLDPVSDVNTRQVLRPARGTQ